MTAHRSPTSQAWLDRFDAEWPARCAAVDALAAEIIANIRARKPAPPPARPPADPLQWDYDRCGAYQNYEFGE